MDQATFHTLFTEHRDKLFEAWNRLPPQEFDAVQGDLEAFLALTARVYQVPRKVILRELAAVQHNIDDGITDDYAPRLHPEE